MDEWEELPLVAGEVIGWRAWGVIATAGRRPREVRDPWLLSLFHEKAWPRDDWLRAECQVLNEDRPTPDPCEESPGVGCHCGVYAARDRAQLAGLRQFGQATGALYTITRPLTVIGECALAGRLIEGSRGWRASKGRVVRLFVPFEEWHVAGPLSEAYNVPVELDNVMRGVDRGHRA
jgi:hypothetical protein